jgi:hypothetical protein
VEPALRPVRPPVPGFGLLVPLLPIGLLACEGDPPPPPPAEAPPPAELVAPPEPERGGAQNRPPRIGKLAWTPPQPTTRDHLRLQVEATDPDGDPVDLSYQWTINGKEVLHLVRDNVPEDAFEKGDELQATVTATDRDGLTHTLSSPAIVIANSPPTFLTDPGSLTRLDGFVIKAADVDNDPLTFSLSGGPDGMDIDPKAGKLIYKGSADEPGGHYKIVVKAEDPDGAFGEWRFEVDVSPGSEAVKKQKAEAAAAAGPGKAGAKAGAPPRR